MAGSGPAEEVDLSRARWASVCLAATLTLLGAACTPAPSTPTSSPAAPAAQAPLVAAEAAAVQPAPAAREVVNLTRATISITGTQWPDFVAEQKGFLEREGLQVETSVVNVRSSITSLITGAIEISFANAGDLILAVDQGADLVGVGSGVERALYKLIAQPDIRTFADLKGKKLSAAGPADAYTHVIRDILRQNGLDPDRDVEFIFGSSSNDRFLAVQAGGVDAALFVPPQDRELIEKGFSVLASTMDYYPQLQLSLTAVRRDWAEQNADVLRRYLRARAGASQWLNDPANRDEATKLLADTLKIPTDVAAYTYDQNIMRIQAFPNDGCIQRVGMEKLIEVLHALGQVQSVSPVERYIDRQWCQT
jgi:ABC-type nitrate/sulfonate/bicarbonate transport system substrate-binding protein